MPQHKMPYCGAVAALAVVSVYASGLRLPALSASTVLAAPYSLLTYTAAHAGWLHAGVNAAVLLVAAEAAARLAGVRRTALMAVIAAAVAGLVFCAATAALNPGASLEGVSAAALALAAYDIAVLRARIPLILLGMLAAAMIFGPNAGGGVAHCAGYAVGLAFAMADRRRAALSRDSLMAERDRIRRKAEDSGYSSLSQHERQILETNLTEK